eukprot:TRINITY_DN16201_c0_g1_i1.p1 TRINITY_DN16201_c0_g1~~TRINITY_DN16201_c0_g1_i1.p1  ORF type:complete len:612 (+),score=162.31 TRINITY_DN16201_c0_g1_i1:114-1949(+)
MASASSASSEEGLLANLGSLLPSWGGGAEPAVDASEDAVLGAVRTAWGVDSPRSGGNRKASSGAGAQDEQRFTPWRRWRKAAHTGDAPSPRTKFSSVVYDGKMVVFGGGFQKEFYGDLYEYHLDACVWRCIQADVLREGRGPSRRRSHRAVLWKNFMMVFGGRVDHGRRNDLFLLDLDTYTWTERVAAEHAEKPPERAAHSAVAWEKYMVVFGGDTGKLEKGHEYLQDLWFHDCEAGTWEEKPTTGELPGGRLGHACALHGSAMYIFGGFNGAALNDMYACDLETLTWRKVNYRVPFCPVSFMCMISEEPPSRAPSATPSQSGGSPPGGSSESPLPRRPSQGLPSLFEAPSPPLPPGSPGVAGCRATPPAGAKHPNSVSSASPGLLPKEEEGAAAPSTAGPFSPLPDIDVSFHSVPSCLFQSSLSVGGAAEGLGDPLSPSFRTVRGLGESVEVLHPPARRTRTQPQPRHGSLLLWGGAFNDDRAHRTELYRFDCRTEEFTAVRNVSDSPAQRLGHTMFLTEDKRLFIFGGCHEDYYSDTHYMHLGPMSLKAFARHAIHMHKVPYKCQPALPPAPEDDAGALRSGDDAEAPEYARAPPQGFTWVKQGLPFLF